MTNAPQKPPTDLELATCLGCGYALRGLEKRRCPECGLVFDPANADTMDTPGGANRRLHAAIHWAPLAVWVATFFVVLFAAYYLYARRFVRIPLSDPIRWWLILAMILATVFRTFARRALMTGKRRRAWTFPVVIALLCVFVMFYEAELRHTTCPHGAVWGFGPIGVAHSTVGGPCRARVPDRRLWNVYGPWYVWVSY